MTFPFSVFTITHLVARFKYRTYVYMVWLNGSAAAFCKELGKTRVFFAIKIFSFCLLNMLNHLSNINVKAKFKKWSESEAREKRNEAFIGVYLQVQSNQYGGTKGSEAREKKETNHGRTTGNYKKQLKNMDTVARIWPIQGVKSLYWNV